MRVSVAGAIMADGGAGSNGQEPYSASGGGGGGGTILITTQEALLGDNLVTAMGGDEGMAYPDGGEGGAGRIRVFSDSVSGTTNPSAFVMPFCHGI